MLPESHIVETHLCSIKDEVWNIEDEDFFHSFPDFTVRQV